MNREIKFRAWEKELKKMYKIFTIIPENDKYVVLMQYTGLKDKNGKEIYEGDIVNVLGNKRVVNFKMGAFLTHKDIAYRWSKMCNIIGNIYENPGLLDSK